MRHGVRKALLVDDETVNRIALARLLLQLGVTRVDEAADGAAALVLAAQEIYDVVLCDIDMRPMDGVSFVRELRRTETSPNRAAPVVMLSKYSADRMRRATREAGADAYIAKPITRDALLEKLSAAAPP